MPFSQYIQIGALSDVALNVRDDSISLFDSYLSTSFESNSDPTLSICLSLRIVALSCFSICFKLSSSNSKHLDNFLSIVFTEFKFTDEDLTKFELHVINKLKFEVNIIESTSLFFSSFLSTIGVSSQLKISLVNGFVTNMNLCFLGM